MLHSVGAPIRYRVLDIDPPAIFLEGLGTNTGIATRRDAHKPEVLSFRTKQSAIGQNQVIPGQIELISASDQKVGVVGSVKRLPNRRLDMDVVVGTAP